MQRISARIRSESVFLITTVAYAILIILTFPYLRYYIDNPDSVSYLSIAGKYASGDFANAVNGYWSPLITWMLAAFYTWIDNEILAFKGLQVMIGWFALFNLVKILQSLFSNRVLQYILALGAIPFMIS